MFLLSYIYIRLRTPTDTPVPAKIAVVPKVVAYVVPNMDKPEPKRFSNFLAQTTRKSEIRI